MIDRTPCPDCGYALCTHFHDSGRYIGCPWRGTVLAPSPILPRVTLRHATSGPRKGHVIAGWPDSSDGATGVLWDLDTGDQWVGDIAHHQHASKALRGRELERAKDHVENLAGGPVRVVNRIT